MSKTNFDNCVFSLFFELELVYCLFFYVTNRKKNSFQLKFIFNDIYHYQGTFHVFLYFFIATVFGGTLSQLQSDNVRSKKPQIIKKKSPRSTKKKKPQSSRKIYQGFLNMHDALQHFTLSCS
jgi:hypothetical protein